MVPQMDGKMILVFLEAPVVVFGIISYQGRGDLGATLPSSNPKPLGPSWDIPTVRMHSNYVGP